MSEKRRVSESCSQSHLRLTKNNVWQFGWRFQELDVGIPAELAVVQIGGVVQWELQKGGGAGVDVVVPRGKLCNPQQLREDVRRERDVGTLYN